MPNPNDKLKLTGDTHAPEVEDDLELEEASAGAPRSAVEEAAPEEEAVVRIGRSAAGRAKHVASRGDAYLDTAREQVRSRPLAAAAVAFFAGFALAVVTRTNR